MERRRTFSREFKLEVVKLVTESGVAVAQAAKDLDVHDNMRASGFVKCGMSPRRRSPAMASRGIARLRKEVAKLKMERDILKKPQPTLRRSRCEVRLRGETPRSLAGQSDARGARCLARWLLRVAHAAQEPAQSERRGAGCASSPELRAKRPHLRRTPRSARRARARTSLWPAPH